MSVVFCSIISKGGFVVNLTSIEVNVVVFLARIFLLINIMMLIWFLVRKIFSQRLYSQIRPVFWGLSIIVSLVLFFKTLYGYVVTAPSLTLLNIDVVVNRPMTDSGLIGYPDGKIRIDIFNSRHEPLSSFDASKIVPIVFAVCVILCSCAICVNLYRIRSSKKYRLISILLVVLYSITFCIPFWVTGIAPFTTDIDAFKDGKYNYPSTREKGLSICLLLILLTVFAWLIIFGQSILGIYVTASSY